MSQAIDADAVVGVRIGEKPTLWAGQPDPAVSRYCVMVAGVPPLPEPATEVSALTGKPVESLCVIGAVWNGEAWQWCFFGPQMKELLGGIVMDNPGLDYGTWYPVSLAGDGVTP